MTRDDNANTPLTANEAISLDPAATSDSHYKYGTSGPAGPDGPQRTLQ